MAYSTEQIHKDLMELDERSFIIKYFLRSENWYFEKILKISSDKILEATDDFKEIISATLGIAHNSVALVGSAKIGLSLSPSKEKCFKPFQVDDAERKASDLDIAIISEKLFYAYWELLRKSYDKRYEYPFYQHIKGDLYRGYISGYNLAQIPGCRKSWREQTKSINQKLRGSLFIKHYISFRIYKSQEDLEEYHIVSLRELKKEHANGTNI